MAAQHEHHPLLQRAHALPGSTGDRRRREQDAQDPHRQQQARHRQGPPGGLRGDLRIPHTGRGVRPSHSWLRMAECWLPEPRPPSPHPFARSHSLGRRPTHQSVDHPQSLGRSVACL